MKLHAPPKKQPKLPSALGRKDRRGSPAKKFHFGTVDCHWRNKAGATSYPSRACALQVLQIMPMLIENRIPVAHDHQKILARKGASTAAPLKDKHAFPSPWTLQGRGMVASPHKRDWLRLMKLKCKPRTLCHHGRQNACRATRPLPRICRVISTVMLSL